MKPQGQGDIPAIGGEGHVRRPHQERAGRRRIGAPPPVARRPLFWAALIALATAPLAAQRYNPGGKRDPFQDLAAIRAKAAPEMVEPPPFSQRPPGLSGLLISEVSVVGTAAGSDQRIAILQGADKFTYVAREGTKLFDGYVETIATDEVVFVREVFDTAGNKTTSEVVKRSG